MNKVFGSQAVILLIITGDIIADNEDFCNVIGYDLKEVKGKRHRMLCRPKHEYSEEYRQFCRNLGEGEFQAEDFQNFGKGGREVWIHAAYNPIFDADGKVYKIVRLATACPTRWGRYP